MFLIIQRTNIVLISHVDFIFTKVSVSTNKGASRYQAWVAWHYLIWMIDTWLKLCYHSNLSIQMVVSYERGLRTHSTLPTLIWRLAVDVIKPCWIWPSMSRGWFLAISLQNNNNNINFERNVHTGLWVPKYAPFQISIITSRIYDGVPQFPKLRWWANH